MPFTTYLRTLLLGLSLFLTCERLAAQQEPQFTQNMFNLSFVNPGHYGFSNGIAITGLLREQWLGFKDEEGNKVAPQTYLVIADAPINFIHGGIGVAISQDKYGFFKDMAVKLGYSYHKTIGSSMLGIGVNANFNNKAGDYTKFISVDPNDQVLSNISSTGVVITDMAAGFFLQSPRYYVSFSSSQLMETGKELSQAAGLVTYKNRRHYYLTGGRTFTMPAFQGYEFTPSLFLKSDGKTIQADVNALIKYNNKVWGGASYRINDAVALMIGMAFNDMEVGYSYDVPTSKIGATGSHEIMIRYVFKIEREKARTGYHNTRYL